MSAAFALDPLALPERTAAPTRPRLQLVPTGPDVVGRPVRISRRGRVARTVGALLVASALAWTGAAALAAGVAVPQHTVTVDAGQTLSSIAAREMPDIPVHEGVAQIQLANGLSSSDVHVGQVLQIPAIG